MDYRKVRSMWSQIYYSKKHHCYKIEIDGDEFWADTFEHAAVRLANIILRDYVVSRSKIL